MVPHGAEYAHLIGNSLSSARLGATCQSTQKQLEGQSEPEQDDS